MSYTYFYYDCDVLISDLERKLPSPECSPQYLTFTHYLQAHQHLRILNALSFSLPRQVIRSQPQAARGVREYAWSDARLRCWEKNGWLIPHWASPLPKR